MKIYLKLLNIFFNSTGFVVQEFFKLFSCQIPRDFWHLRTLRFSICILKHIYSYKSKVIGEVGVTCRDYQYFVSCLRSYKGRGNYFKQLFWKMTLSIILIRDQSFSAYATFSEKLAFLSPIFGNFCVRTKWMIPNAPLTEHFNERYFIKFKIWTTVIGLIPLPFSRAQ